VAAAGITGGSATIKATLPIFLVEKPSGSWGGSRRNQRDGGQDSNHSLHGDSSHSTLTRNMFRGVKWGVAFDGCFPAKHCLQGETGKKKSLAKSGVTEIPR
jgi:hypothetical protein